MAGRVYDPIHDVFQEAAPERPEQPEADTSATATTATTTTTIELNHSDSDSDDDPTAAATASNSPGKAEGQRPPLASDNARASATSVRIAPPVAPAVRYTRHLKKPDGDYFSRRDVQFHFLETLLADTRPLFTNIFKRYFLNPLIAPVDPSAVHGSDEVKTPSAKNTSPSCNVHDADYDARRFFHHDKLTFSQLYVLCLATSTKSSKILRDKLLLDPQVAFSTCLLAILVNIGRLNTTINFYLAMTSQLRTFHSIPALQHMVADPKSLQDTPRLKSIVKSLPIGNDPVNLHDMYAGTASTVEPPYNVINMLFAMCDNVPFVNVQFLTQQYVKWNKEKDSDLTLGPLSLFSILDQHRFKCADRCNALLWLLYVHLETDLSKEKVQESLRLFGEPDEDNADSYHIRLRDNDLDETTEDVDTAEEVAFGLAQRDRRKVFIKQVQLEKKGRAAKAKDKDAETNDAGKGTDTSESGKGAEPTPVPTAVPRGKTLMDIDMLTSPSPEKRPVEKEAPHGNALASILNPVSEPSAESSAAPLPLAPATPVKIAPAQQPGETPSSTASPQQTQTQTELKHEAPDFVPPPKKRRRRRTKAEMLTAKRLQEEQSAKKNLAMSVALSSMSGGTGSTADDSNTPSATTPTHSPTKESSVVSTATPSGASPRPSPGMTQTQFSTDYRSTAAKLNEDRVTAMIQLDEAKKLDGMDKTQRQFLADLQAAHRSVRDKRREVGLVKIFSEYEDVTMASVIGIRGKKRKKFQDGLLGFETDCLRSFAAAKQAMLDHVKAAPVDEDIDTAFFKLG